MLVFVLANILLSLAFASGVKTVIPFSRNRCNCISYFQGKDRIVNGISAIQ